jgi:UTP--glucose-1-phosphate uridylyltransferase
LKVSAPFALIERADLNLKIEILMKALIPAAGLGTRYLPWSKAVPKELIPVGAYPVLHYVVAEAKAAGCREIGIILSEGKEAIRRYFTRDEEFMEWLDTRGKRKHLAAWEALMDGLEFVWLDQEEQHGLGDAVRCGTGFAGDDPVCLLLGDTLMEGGSPLKEMLARYRAGGCSQVAVEPVSAQRATRYGVCGGTMDETGNFQLDQMIEKPRVDEIPVMRDSAGTALPNAYAIAARYLLSPAVFRALEHAEAGLNGEIQLTDAMAKVLEAEGFAAVELPGKRRDIGVPESSEPLPEYL